MCLSNFGMEIIYRNPAELRSVPSEPGTQRFAVEA
jgi:hypothetical protein